MMVFFLFSLVYTVGALLSSAGLDLISGTVLIGAGIFMYFYFRKRYCSLLAPPALFSLSWIACIGIASLKLSALQSVWLPETWIAFYLIYLFFLLSFELCFRRLKRRPPAAHADGRLPAFSVYLLTAVSAVCFLLEAAVLGFVPLFTDGTPHAYSSFHLSGIHYFTVLCVLVPALSFLTLRSADFPGSEHRQLHPDRRTAALVFCSAVSLLLPVLMVSRYQLVFSVLLLFLCLLIRYEKQLTVLLTRRLLIRFGCMMFLLSALLLFLTVERAHSVSYLNGIFEMKNPGLPILISQPYMYIANNFENFNLLVRDLTEHTHGLRMAFPLFALTGLKFSHPELVSFPLYVTKAELTTVTLFYDAYYDFGTAGCAAFSALLGAVYAFFFRRVSTDQSAFPVILYAQLLGYLLLAFFTAWFSNPTVWFYFAVCTGLYLLGRFLQFHRKAGDSSKRSPAGRRAADPHAPKPVSAGQEGDI